MKQILIDNISDTDYTRIHNALTSAYSTETCEEAVSKFIKQTVKNIEESDLLRSKEEEAITAIEGIDDVAI